MTHDRDWLTPKLMGRLFLFKAPMLQWLAAWCIQVFGAGLFTIRLPSVLLGALGIAVIFVWTALRRSWPFAALAAALLLSDSIWATFSRLCFTDVLSSTLALLAMYVLANDPRLTLRWNRIAFGVLAAASMLSKSIVGVLPFVALALYWVTMPRDDKPRIRSMVECGLAAIVIAAPWHLYQLWTHTQWFWIEFVKYQLLAVGVTAPTGVTGYPLFYPRRLASMDPVLCVFLLAAGYCIVRTVRTREPVRMVAVCWTIAVIAALAAFRGRSVSYLVVLMPALCLIAGLFSPVAIGRRWIAVMLLLTAAFGVKATFAGFPWSLPYTSPAAIEPATRLRDYYYRNRDTELFIASPDDSFYAITLPLPRVRYCYVDARRVIAGFAPHYLELGIALTPAQLANLPSLMPVYSQKLTSWGVRSTEPVGEAILLDQAEDIALVIATRPRADYDLPANWESFTRAVATHDIQRSGDRIILLAREVAPRVQPARPLPTGW